MHDPGGINMGLVIGLAAAIGTAIGVATHEPLNGLIGGIGIAAGILFVERMKRRGR